MRFYGRQQAAQVGGTHTSGLLQAVDFLADQTMLQRVLNAYAERLFPPAAAEVDADFQQVHPLPCMSAAPRAPVCYQ